MPKCEECDDTGVIQVVVMKLDADGLPIEESESFQICECQSSID